MENNNNSKYITIVNTESNNDSRYISIKDVMKLTGVTEYIIKTMVKVGKIKKLDTGTRGKWYLEVTSVYKAFNLNKAGE